MKNEMLFENSLRKNAPYFKCSYFKIPDTKMLNKFNRKFNKEEKRFCDGILITPQKNYCIECKYGNNSLKPHQKMNMEAINKINGSFFLLRKKSLKKGIFYFIEKPEKNVLLKTEKLEDIFMFFNEI